MAGNQHGGFRYLSLLRTPRAVCSDLRCLRRDDVDRYAVIQADGASNPKPSNLGSRMSDEAVLSIWEFPKIGDPNMVP